MRPVVAFAESIPRRQTHLMSLALEIREDLHVVAITQILEHPHIDILADEPDRTISKQCLDPAGVSAAEAARFLIIGHFRQWFSIVR